MVHPSQLNDTTRNQHNCSGRIQHQRNEEKMIMVKRSMQILQTCPTEQTPKHRAYPQSTAAKHWASSSEDETFKALNHFLKAANHSSLHWISLKLLSLKHLSVQFCQNIPNDAPGRTSCASPRRRTHSLSDCDTVLFSTSLSPPPSLGSLTLPLFCTLACSLSLKMHALSLFLDQDTYLYHLCVCFLFWRTCL